MRNILHKIFAFLHYILWKEDVTFSETTALTERVEDLNDNVWIIQDTLKHSNSNRNHYWVKCRYQQEEFFIRLTFWEFEKGRHLARRNTEDAPPKE
jgi:hypothetical protein